MAEKKKSRLTLMQILLGAYIVVTAVWVTTLAVSSGAYLLGFSIPKILISPEFMSSANGFAFLYIAFPILQEKRKAKIDIVLHFIGMLVGFLLLFVGVYVLLFENPNFFAYTCLTISAASILLNARQIQARFKHKPHN